ncbi:hypothetical protein ES707_07965 [subsurface metagenome]
MLSCTDKEIFKREEKLMSKRVKVFISVLVVALLLTVGATATVMAEGEEETTPSPEASAEGLLERVADILGIDQEDLTAAFKQARQEMWDDAFISRLNQAVEEGRITQEQANAIREWRGQKPEFMEPGMFKYNFRFRSSLRTRQQNSPGGWFCPRLPRLAD